MHWTDCSLTMPRLLVIVKNGSVFWELTHWNHIWWLLWSISRKQLLITTSSQIWKNTKENIYLKLMKKLRDSCSWSFIQSIQKLLQICVHSPQVQPHFQLHFYHPHVLIKRRTLCGGRLCQTANVKCRHLWYALHWNYFICHWVPLQLNEYFLTLVWCKANYENEITLAWKRQQNMWHATDNSMEMLNWTGLETEMDIGMDQTNYETMK